MNVDKDIEIINDIASRLGVAAEYIVPEIAHMGIAQNAFWVVLSLFILIISVRFLKTKRSKEAFDVNNDDSVAVILTFFAFVAVPFAFIILTFSIYDLIGWIVSPTAKTIAYVVELIK